MGRAACTGMRQAYVQKMCTDMLKDKRVDTHADMCTGMLTHIFTDMCRDIRRDLFMDMGIDMQELGYILFFFTGKGEGAYVPSAHKRPCTATELL